MYDHCPFYYEKQEWLPSNTELGASINHVGRGRGFSQMSILLRMPYLLSKEVHKGGGGVKNVQKTIYMVYE